MSGDAIHRVAAIDALVRGVKNVRANAELLIVQFLSSLFIVVSFAVPLVLFLRQIGVDPAVLIQDDPAQVQAAFANAEFDPASLLRAAGVGLLVLLVGGTILFLLYCWAQAGTLAVLSAGDAQAPVVASAPVDVFRTWSWRAFLSWSFRYGGRFFWLMNLYGILFSLATLLLILPFAFFARSGNVEEMGPACLLACGLAIPLIFVFFLLGLAMQMSCAALVVEDLGPLRALRRGLSLTGRRLGGLVLLLLLVFCASLALAGVMLFFKLGLTLALREPSALRFGLRAGLEILNFLLSTTIGLILSAAMIAIVRGEARQDAVAPVASPPLP